MSDSITCEHFDITDAIRQHVEENVASVKDYLPKNEPVAVFLTKPAKQTFQALFRVHAYKKDFVSKEADENLYNAVSAARDHLIRQLDDHRSRQIAKKHDGR